MDDYRNRRAVVTGTASGIGAAVAKALVAAGADVIGIDRRDGVPAVRRHLHADLEDPASIDAAVAAIDGPVDALFNCAGLAPTHPLRAVIRVNVLGQRHLADALVAKMTAGAAIASVSSNGGLDWRERRAMLDDFLDTPDFAAGDAWVARHEGVIANGYRFAKEALTLWTLRRSAQLIGRGIRVNCTSPGAVQTPMLVELEERIPAAAIDATAVPIGRRSSPAEQAAPLLFLNSAAAAYVNGVDLPVDGGFAASRALR